MRFLKWLLILLLSISMPAQAITYPQTPRGKQVDVYHGDKIADPYRWMEQTTNQKVVDWLDQQKKISVKYLDATPVSNAVRQRAKSIRRFERYNLLDSINGQILFSIETPGSVYAHSSGLKTYCLLDIKEPDKAKELFKEDSILPEQKNYSNIVVSPDTQKAVYAVTVSGYEREAYMKGDFSKWFSTTKQRIKNFNTGKEYPEIFSNITPIGWKSDSSGFYYKKFHYAKDGEPVSEDTLYFHLLGTNSKKDKPIFVDKTFNAFHGQKYIQNDCLFYTAYSGRLKSALFCRKLDGSGARVQLLPWTKVPLVGVKKWYLGLGNDRLFFMTDTPSGKSKIVSMKFSESIFKHPQPKPVYTQVVPESTDTLQMAIIAGDHIIAAYLHDGHTELLEYDYHGKRVREIALPGIGTVTALCIDSNRKDFTYQFESFAQAPCIFKQNVDEETAQPIIVPEVHFDPNDIVTNVVRVETPDGAEIPMFLVHKSGTKINSNTPVMLEVYGGFGVNMVPSFETEALVWIEMGGVFARACIRGGAERGEVWHQAASGLKKETSIRDFISCAEWLCKNKITSPSKLGISGCSNGGLLTAGAMMKRPDLFGGVCIDSAVLDMLRFHTLNPQLYVNEYGDVKIQKQYRSLRALSPLHQIRKGTVYPATLITVKDFDNIVSPGHSYKFTAALQHAQKGDNPILIDSIKLKDHGLSAEKDYDDRYLGLERIIFLSRALKFEDHAKQRLDWQSDSFSN